MDQLKLRNPLLCGGTSLPYNLLLAIKLLALMLLASRELMNWTGPLLPFFSFLDGLPPELGRAARVVAAAALVCILFNIKPRAMAGIAGMCGLMALLWNRAAYKDGKALYSLVLILVALGKAPMLIRWQIVIMYVGAFIDKLLTEDWRSGQFFDNFMRNWVHSNAYVWLVSLAPGLLVAKTFSWATIVIEGALAVGFAVRKFWKPTLIFAIIFHALLSLGTGEKFSALFYTIMASLLAFVEWPREQMVLIYDGDCGFCTQVKRFFEKIDFDRLTRWVPYQDGEGLQHGVSNEDAMERVYLIRDGVKYQSYEAFRRILLSLPIFYFSFTVFFFFLISSARMGTRIGAASVLLLLLLPIITPRFIGDAVYHWIARNRYRISSACSIEVQRDKSRRD